MIAAAYARGVVAAGRSDNAAVDRNRRSAAFIERPAAAYARATYRAVRRVLAAVRVDGAAVDRNRAAGVAVVEVIVAVAAYARRAYAAVGVKRAGACCGDHKRAAVVHVKPRGGAKDGFFGHQRVAPGHREVEYCIFSD
ncbi:hypothetical protein SDC9_209797 [bioreactor metagenome]|uniref:Uncharacterized protein n=1 Tax=bioreactor metagenome TaxID=1076179 RepID=A0A645JEL7_9ZZZZ